MALHLWLTMTMAALFAALPGVPGAPGAAAPGVPGAVGTAAAPGCAGSGAAARCWPVAGPGVRGRPVVLRAFEPPATPWAAGHRGVDLRAGPGTPVRAAAPGEVAFAGRVAGTGVVVLRIAPGLRVTYEPVRATVPVGARVPAGGQVGVLDPATGHCGTTCLHWGLLRGDAYLDPLSLLPAVLLRAGPSRLLPVFGPAGPGGSEGGP
ncbi:murein hydrolase activator EnvC family protein [Actinacidiphila alni]|uniref:murein hydrolase activator EnvC family protein n=1 Tax=Actinacidiphila alni TaxID=380248 RepID=UPI00345623B2